MLHKKKLQVAGAKNFQSQAKRVEATQSQSFSASFASNCSRSSGEEALILSPCSLPGENRSLFSLILSVRR